jgi:hypothetical protein
VQSVINEKALREGYFLRTRDASFFSHLFGDSLEEGVRGIELLEQAGDLQFGRLFIPVDDLGGRGVEGFWIAGVKVNIFEKVW